MDKAERYRMRCRGTSEVLADLQATVPEAYAVATVVGRWVWCEFGAPPSAAVREALKARGFHWSRRRGVWQHPCGHFVSRASRSDPRATHWVSAPADWLAAAEETAGEPAVA